MKKVLWFVLIVGGIFVLSLSPAQAGVIYNTFGAGDSYNEYLGATVGKVSSYNSDTGTFFDRDRDQGNLFWLDGSYTLDTIELAMRLVEGPNALNVWLMGADFNEPGDVIETFTFEMVSGVSIYTGDSVLHPVLSPGSIYWLVASTSADTRASWQLTNSSTVPVTYAWRIDQGSWDVTDSMPQGAFRITGTPVTEPVPEPSTMLLVGSGLLGLVGYGRERLKK